MCVFWRFHFVYGIWLFAKSKSKKHVNIRLPIVLDKGFKSLPPGLHGKEE